MHSDASKVLLSVQQLRRDFDTVWTVAWSAVATDAHNAIDDALELRREYRSLTESLGELEGSLEGFVGRLGPLLGAAPVSTRIVSAAPIARAHKPRRDPRRLIDSDRAYEVTDDITFTKPVSFTFLGQTHSVRTWRELYMRVCLALRSRDARTFGDMVETGDLFHNGPANMRVPLELGDGVYTEGNVSAGSLLRIIRERLMPRFGLDESSLTFRIRAV